MATVDIRYLIPDLRLTIGDTTPATYRYDDEWLRIASLGAIKTLSRWWNYRYLVDANKLIYRNPNITFIFDEPPVIMSGDERPIILRAAIIILEGSLENTAWDLGSWRDAEIAFSNLEKGRQKNDNLRRLQEELLELMIPPVKKLASPIKRSLPGYKNNNYEREQGEPA